MGIIDSVGKLGDSAHRKISTSMSVKEDGEFQGYWNLKEEGDCFTQIIKNSVSFIHSEVVITKRIYISSILSLDVESSSKDTASITKAALGGVALAGPVGAIAGGLFAASKNTYLVKITMKDKREFKAYLSQDAYDQLNKTIDDQPKDDSECKVHVSQIGGDPLITKDLLLILVTFFGVVVLIIAIGSISEM